MTLDQQRSEFVADIGRDRRIWMAVIVPQLLLIGLASLSLATIASYGLYSAIAAFREKANTDVLTKGVSVFVEGLREVTASR